MDYRTGNGGGGIVKKTDVLRTEETWYLREEKVARQLSDILCILRSK